MFQIRYATRNDKAFWYSLERHMAESELELKIRDKRGYIISDDTRPIGIMRYNLFGDVIPFLTLIYLEESYLGKGFGKQAMLHWEDEMRQLGHSMIMTSTQVNEQSQHFDRKLGYKDKGCIVMDIPPFEQPLEMFMIKALDDQTSRV